jgi:sec-independent protein translocase protein TatA
MFSGWDRPSHWVVIAILALVLFGYKKLPDAARSVGRSLRIFKSEMKGMSADDQARADAAAPAVADKPIDKPVAETPAAPTSADKDAAMVNGSVPKSTANSAD